MRGPTSLMKIQKGHTYGGWDCTWRRIQVKKLVEHPGDGGEYVDPPLTLLMKTPKREEGGGWDDTWRRIQVKEQVEHTGDGWYRQGLLVVPSSPPWPTTTITASPLLHLRHHFPSLLKDLVCKLQSITTSETMEVTLPYQFNPCHLWTC
ncbi:hypothetical protein M0R45_032311 [Rubus argutus]|uniref:Uncharacterized protein n=1 Tax=Rubus argutus TaxID=59490 RepID=A0AAW1WIZ5_RUBAR